MNRRRDFCVVAAVTFVISRLLLVFFANSIALQESCVAMH